MDAEFVAALSLDGLVGILVQHSTVTMLQKGETECSVPHIPSARLAWGCFC